MSDVSLFRLYLLRGMYLLIAIGMGVQVWPLMFHHRPWELMHGVADSMLAALTALCLLGVRYPLKMLPLLFYEFAWKAIWLVAIALPLWRANRLDADTMETVQATVMGVVLVPLVTPWRYVWTNYVLNAGDRWRNPPSPALRPAA
jgi:hypothetical protein